MEAEEFAQRLQWYELDYPKLVRLAAFSLSIIIVAMETMNGKDGGATSSTTVLGTVIRAAV